MMKKRLLINYVFYKPVGHLVEAMKCARGYYDAHDGNIEISLIVNAESPVSLFDGCEWIQAVYPVNLQELQDHGEEADCLKDIPRQWDIIITNAAVHDFVPGWDEEDLIAAQSVLLPIFTQAEIVEKTPTWNPKIESIKIENVPYAPNTTVTLDIPEAAKTYVKKFEHAGPILTILPAGSAGLNQSPSLKVWGEICAALTASIPNLKIYFTGITESVDGQTATAGVTIGTIDELVATIPNAENAFNIGMWNQIALMQQSDIFLSPHSGFSFITGLVGTPWLIVSGCPWHEYLFNEQPFYSVLPNCQSYPSQCRDRKCDLLLDSDQKSICMRDENVRNRIDDIVHGAKLLLDTDFDYTQATKLHLEKLEASSFESNEFSFFDGVNGFLRPGVRE